jgi:glycerophosphoryl diester phosphodiesterase
MAHRGFSLDGAENSAAAFAAAVDLGVQYLETDVHATRDGRLVAFHDAHLDRVSDSHGDLRSMTWEQLRSVRIRGTEPIALFEDLVGAWPHVRWNVDVKSVSGIAPLVDVVRRTRCGDRLLVASFSDRRRRAVLRGIGDRPGSGPMAWSPGVLGTGAVLAAAPLGPAAVRRALAGAACIQVPRTAGPLPILTPRLLDAVHRSGAQVHVWTIDDPAVMTELLDLGVDALVTNRADLAMELLRVRASRGSP